jgi:galactokinase
MDQLACAAARSDHALLIDCRSLETEAVPMPAEVAVAVLDTSTRRGLADSAYNQRRTECETTARALGVQALRDAALEQVATRAAALGEVAQRRARHVIGENARVLEAVQAMRRDDAEALGELMNASHQSLREDFEVVSPALDAMAGCARGDPACYGARMTGAGFGGSVVALVRGEEAAGFLERVGGAYQAATGLAPALYLCRPSDGVAIVPVDER